MSATAAGQPAGGRLARPLPNPDEPGYEPYWAGARDHRLVVQRCEFCGHWRWTPADICPNCLRVGGEWTQVSGEASVYSYCVYTRVLNPAFSDVPYTVGLVELAEGPRMITRLVGDLSGLEVGSPVHPSFEDAGSGVTLVNFSLAEARR